MINIKNDKFIYASGSNQNTDEESRTLSDQYYFDVPNYIRLSENGYQFPFNSYQGNKKG